MKVTLLEFEKNGKKINRSLNSDLSLFLSMEMILALFSNAVVGNVGH